MPLKELERIDRHKIEERGEGTKYAILMAGLKLFGEYGLKGTSVRMIADEAGANVAAIPYYFTSKENLYHAVVTYITHQIEDHMKDVRGHIEPILRKEKLSKGEAEKIVLMIVQNMAKMFVESDEPKAWAQIIMREQANPTEAFDIFYNGHIKSMQAMAAKCVGTCLGKDPKSAEVKIRLHALIGQVLGFLVSRETLLRHLGVKKFNKNFFEHINAVLKDHTYACLKS